MNIWMNAVIATSAVLTITRAAEAHPGHGTDGGGYALSHYLADPLHIIGIGAALVVAIVGVLFWVRHRGAAQSSGR